MQASSPDTSSGPVPLTPVELVVLGLVRAAGTATPYDLKAGVSASLGYFWDFPHSQLYAAPDKLTARGLLHVEQEPGGRRRKSYSITSEGETMLDRWIAEPPIELPEYRIPALLGIFFGADAKALAQRMLPLHRERLAEYEQLVAFAEALPPDSPQGPLKALYSGLMAERTWLEYYERLLDED